MKKVLGILAALLFAAVVIATGVFLFKKSQAKPVVYQTASPVTTDLVRKTVATGAVVPRKEVAAVFRGEAGAEVGITADPGEVMAWRWVEISGLQREIIATPQVFTPWLRIYMAGYRAQILGEKGQAWSQTR